MTDPLDPSATHGLDLHDAHHVSMDKFDLGHLNGLDDVDDHFPDFDNDEAFAVPDVKPDMSPHHSNMDMNMNGGGMMPQMMPPPASASMPPPAHIKAEASDVNGNVNVDANNGNNRVGTKMDDAAAAEAVKSGSHAGTTGTNLYDAQWSKEEQAVLERGMETYGSRRVRESVEVHQDRRDAPGEGRAGRRASHAMDEQAAGEEQRGERRGARVETEGELTGCRR